MADTLVLGHGRYYTDDCRCSPMDINEWIHDPYVCVDNMRYVNPDIVYDLIHGIDYGTKYSWGDEKRMNVPKTYNCRWTFAKDESYRRVIDCAGGILQMDSSLTESKWYPDPDPGKYSQKMLKEICRVLQPNGLFYGNFRHKLVYQKQNGHMVNISNQPSCYKHPIS